MPARVIALSRTSLFLERFWCEFWKSFKFLKPVSKTYRPKNDIFCLLITLLRSVSRFDILYFECALRHGQRFYFRGKRCPKMCLKINSSVKTPWHRPSMGVARSGLWVPSAAKFHLPAKTKLTCVYSLSSFLAASQPSSSEERRFAC